MDANELVQRWEPIGPIADGPVPSYHAQGAGGEYVQVHRIARSSAEFERLAPLVRQLESHAPPDLVEVVEYEGGMVVVTRVLPSQVSLGDWLRSSVAAVDSAPPTDQEEPEPADSSPGDDYSGYFRIPQSDRAEPPGTAETAIGPESAERSRPEGPPPEGPPPERPPAERPPAEGPGSRESYTALFQTPPSPPEPEIDRPRPDTTQPGPPEPGGLREGYTDQFEAAPPPPPPAPREEASPRPPAGAPPPSKREPPAGREQSASRDPRDRGDPQAKPGRSSGAERSESITDLFRTREGGRSPPFQRAEGWAEPKEARARLEISLSEYVRRLGGTGTAGSGAPGAAGTPGRQRGAQPPPVEDWNVGREDAAPQPTLGPKPRSSAGRRPKDLIILGSILVGVALIAVAIVVVVLVTAG